MPHSGKGVGLALDELRQAGAGGGVDLRKEALGVLLNQAVQRGLLGAVALVVNRGTTLRPVGLTTDGSHALLTSSRPQLPPQASGSGRVMLQMKSAA